MIGDDTVDRVSDRNIQLEGEGHTIWYGIEGARIEGLPAMLTKYLKAHPAPTTLVIHVGANDLFRNGTLYYRHCVRKIIQAIGYMLPDTRIIWFDVSLRAFYYGEEKPGGGKRFVHALNAYAHAMCNSIPNLRFIKHTHFASCDHSLYMSDGARLSDKGNEQFLADLSEGLSFLNSHPGKMGYPLGR